MGRKKKSPPAAQKTFEADGFPKAPSAELAKRRDLFITAKRDQAEASEEKATAEANLIEQMQKEGVRKVKLDGENKFFELTEEPHIKIRTVPKDKRDNQPDDE